MYDSHLNKTKPPSGQMIEFLMECHERELMNRPPCEATERGANGLIDRKVVRTEYFTDEKGKRFLGVLITNEGRSFLKGIMQS